MKCHLTPVYFIISPQFDQFPSVSLTALPIRMAELQVSAGAGRVLLGSLRAADVLDLVVERFERGVDFSIMLTEVSRSLVGPHVPERIRGLFSLTQTSEGRHVNTRARGTRRTGGSGVSGGTLRGKEERWTGYIWHCATCRCFFFCLVMVPLV